MSEIDVMYTRTYDGDYLADFDCNVDDLPKSNVFFYKAIQADELAAMRSRIAELEAQAATLTPRRCSRECYLRGWQAAQEAAIEYYIRWTSDSGFVVKGISDNIRAMQPPDDCGDCNPLAPSKPQSQASLSDQLLELVQLANANGLYDAADYIRRED